MQTTGALSREIITKVTIYRPQPARSPRGSCRLRSA